MATKRIQFPWLSGETGLTINVLPPSGGTPLNASPLTVSETSSAGWFEATMTEAASGNGKLVQVIQSSVVAAIYKVDLIEQDGAYACCDGPTAGEIAALVSTGSLAVLMVPADLAQQLPDPETITARRGDTLRYAFQLGNLTGWSKISFTVKRKPATQDDDAAILSVWLNVSSGTDGLIRLNGAAASDASKASMAISGALVDGLVNLVVDADIMAQLLTEKLSFDVQVNYTNGLIVTPAKGVFDVIIDVTQSVS